MMGLRLGPSGMFWKGMEGKMKKLMAEKKLRGFPLFPIDCEEPTTVLHLRTCEILVM